MKKICTLLLIFAMILSLCACDNGGKQAEKTSGTEVSSETANENTVKSETWEKSSDDAVSGRAAFAATTSEFKTNFEKLINASEYEVKSDNETISYHLKHENTVDYNLDYVIKFYDGSNITLPTTHEAMKNSGWSTDMDDSEQISNKVQTGVEYTNSKSESIVLWTQNLDESTTEKTIALKDCALYALDLTLFSEKSKKDEALGEYVKYYEKNNVPDFSLSNGITQNSDIAEVIEKLGAPADTTYSVKYNKITLTYRVKLDKWYSNVNFVFGPEGNYMRSMKYEYSYADIA